jgi:CRP-like cAMP-binding protein
MYVVTEGEVNILLGDQILDVLGPGGIFGEMALIDSSPRSASAIAKTDCKLVPVSRQRFTFLVQQTPYFSLEVMHVMAERLRRIMRAQRRAEESP